MSNERTDVHSPKNLVTEDYEFLTVVDYDHSNETEGMAARDRVEQARFLVREYGPFAGVHSSAQCDHCGAFLRYAAWLLHKPTTRIIEVGEICLDNRFGRATREFQSLRKQRKLDRERQEVLQYRKEFAEINPDLAWLNGKMDDVPEVVRWSEFIYDIRDKFQKWGNLSQKQVDAVRKTVAKSEERARKQDIDEQWVTVPYDGERVEVSGEVIRVKFVESVYGTTRKMLLKANGTDGNWKLWVTVPSKFEVVQGDKVTVKCKVERSWNDDTFGIGSRPKMVKVEKGN